MGTLKIDRIGGLAGFGGSNAHLRSRGEIDTINLSEQDRKTVEDLFAMPVKERNNLVSDGFRYRISREAANGTENIEVNEDRVPNAIRECVKDEFI